MNTTSGSRSRPAPLDLHLSHITPHCHPHYPPDSQAAAEEERARKKAEEDQAKEKVCLGTYPDMRTRLHSVLGMRGRQGPAIGVGG